MASVQGKGLVPIEHGLVVLLFGSGDQLKEKLRSCPRDGKLAVLENGTTVVAFKSQGIKGYQYGLKPLAADHSDAHHVIHQLRAKRKGARVDVSTMILH